MDGRPCALAIVWLALVCTLCEAFDVTCALQTSVTGHNDLNDAEGWWVADQNDFDDAEGLLLASKTKFDAENDAMKTSNKNPLPPRLRNLDTSEFSPSAKFYVYTGLDWMSMKCDGVPLEEVLSDSSWTNKFPKHSDDFWFMKHALSHPMRTEDPDEATLFIVPGLLNIISQQMFPFKQTPYWHCCVEDVCDEHLPKVVNEMLENSTWFQRSGGTDHIIVNSHWNSNVMRKWKNLNSCNSIAFEENSMRAGRCRVASTYVGRPCAVEKEKRDGFAMVASLHLGLFPGLPHLDRAKTCQWMNKAVSEEPHAYNISICGPGPQCPALARAHFGLQARGDTWGSNRVMDTILSRTVPVFTAKKQFQVLPPLVPWKEMSVLASLRGFDLFRSGLQSATQDYQKLIRKVEKYAPLLDWKRPLGAFERYMLFFEECAKEHAARKLEENSKEHSKKPAKKPRQPF